MAAKGTRARSAVFTDVGECVSGEHGVLVPEGGDFSQELANIALERDGEEWASGDLAAGNGSCEMDLCA
jgi:hypothetical protein